MECNYPIDNTHEMAPADLFASPRWLHLLQDQKLDESREQAVCLNNELNNRRLSVIIPHGHKRLYREKPY